MKDLRRVLCAVMLACVTVTFSNAQSVSAPASAVGMQDSTGLPGDNFSLHGALELFKKANSPEEFEKLLNTEDNHVNNLDLNGDGDIDYVRVVGKMEKDIQVYALQVPVSEKESQDIAVIELEKTGDANAVVQIVGDEDIYGEQKIVEPDGGGEDDEEVEEKGEGGGPNASSFANMYPPRIVVNVWGWPSVRFVYAPAYRVWVSPWRWAVYPAWWRPWRPLAWRVFHPFRTRYHVGFVTVRTHRVVHARRIYTPGRVTSVSVTSRHRASVTHYRTTKTATIKTKHGTAKVKTTRSTTKVKKGRR
jgi:hypothetical protein